VDLSTRLETAKHAAAEAAKVIRHYYAIQQAGNLDVEIKSDDSPVTQADLHKLL